MLGAATTASRVRLLRRFTEFAKTFPWTGDRLTSRTSPVSLTSGSTRLAPSTARGYHLSLRMFCDYLTDARYDWPRQCRDRFAQVPSQVA